MLGILVVLLLPGCFLPVNDATPPLPRKQVKLGGTGLNLGETAQPLVSCPAFTQRVNDLLAARRMASAKRWVERYPDVALETLRRSTAAQSGDRALQFIAEVHDRQCGSDWLALLRDRAADPARYARHDALRQQLAELTQAGRHKEAAALPVTDLPSRTPGTALALDAWQAHGAALLLAGRPAEAEAAFARAIKLAESGSRYQTAHLSLLHSEALRRAGKVGPANAAWREAVQRIVELAKTNAADPILWERASYLRPVDVPWPSTVVLHFLNAAARSEAEVVKFSPETDDPAKRAEDEAIIWRAIGQLRLERGEAQAALAAFKRAESMTANPRSRSQLALEEARALLQMNLAQAAMPLLVRLAAHQEDGETAAGALALLGAAKFQDGSAEQARALLERALARTDWPGRAEAEADLGLVYLALANEEKGLHWLHSAQRRFEARDQPALLEQSLTNEMNYFAHKGRPREAASIRRQLEMLQSGGLMLDGGGS
jgi:tetratricopeptide (TPR) repeat protein